MKFLIFTPASEKSAIGRMVREVNHALLEHGHEITIIRSEDLNLIETPIHDFGVVVERWDSTKRIDNLLQTADGVIYHIGNNYEYHRGCIEWLPKAPGIICLHDYVLSHLFNAWSVHHPHEALAILERWYGKKEANRFFRYSHPDEFIEKTAAHSPMTEWLVSQASGVVAHSSWGVGRVMLACAGPVDVIPLAYNAPTFSCAPNKMDKSRKFTIITFGYIVPNKRIESVIHAIGSSSVLKNNVIYQIVGEINPELFLKVTTLASKLGVNITITGRVTDEDLYNKIASADVVCCLRFPTFESASASAIEAMLYGKPTVVTNTGFYQEIPDQCVLKVRIDHEIADIKFQFENLYANNNLRIAMGQNAHKWAAQTFTADNYARKLVAIVNRGQAAIAKIKDAYFFAGELARWGGKTEHAHCIAELFEDIT